MIKHIVMWRLKAEAGGQTREENARNMKQRLEELPSRIPQIRSLEVGLNVRESERASDVALYAEFDSLEDLATYIRHPAHQEVATYIREITSEIRVVDYEA